MSLQQCYTWTLKIPSRRSANVYENMKRHALSKSASIQEYACYIFFDRFICRTAKKMTTINVIIQTVHQKYSKYWICANIHVCRCVNIISGFPSPVLSAIIGSELSSQIIRSVYFNEPISHKDFLKVFQQQVLLCLESGSTNYGRVVYS